MKKERKTLFILLSVLLTVLALSIFMIIKLERADALHHEHASNRWGTTVLDLDKSAAQAFGMLQNNELNQAEDLLEALVAQYPKESEPRLLLGSTYYRQKRYLLAEQTFLQLLRYHPDNAAGYNNLGETLIKLKRFAEAKKALLKAVKLSPENTGILLNAANLHAMLREDAEAIKFLQQALAKGEEAASILRYRELMMLQERPEFKKFYEQMNNNPPSEQ